MKRTALLALPLCVLLAACGSTVQDRGSVAEGPPGQGLSGSQDPQSLTGGTTTSPGSSVGDTPNTSSSGSGSSSSAGGGLPKGTPVSASAGGTGTSGSGAVVPGGVASTNARGVTATTINIGLEYIKGADEARSNAGFSGVTSGDQLTQLKILVAEINRTGGMAGRKVVPVIHAYDASTGSNNTTYEQAACQDFTSDHKVFAVLSALNHTDVFLQCLSKAGLPYISAPGLTISDNDVFRRFPLHLEVNAVSLSEQGRMFGKPLGDTGYYTKGAKVGLITFDQPNFTRAVRQDLIPGLSAIGVKLTDQVALTFPQSTSDQGALAAQIQSAVLQFRQNGVTHVLITDVSALATVLFATSAASQKYYPRLGWLSPNGGQAAADLLSDKQSLQGAVELGWYPTIDTDAAHETIVPPGSAACAKLYASKGYKTSSRNEDTVLQLQCEIFWYSQKAANAATPLTAQGFVQAFAGSADSVRPASVFSIDLHGRSDGASAYRVLRWQTACTCFTAAPGLKSLR